MTMQVTHSPKPKIFGKGYGKHVAYNYALMKRFFWLGWKMLVNMVIPAAFYEKAHWEVVEMYHKMSGFRHGTNNDHRCNECGHEKLTSDDKHLRYAELKDIEQDCQRVEEFDMAMDKYRAEEDDTDTRIGIRGLDYAADADRPKKELELEEETSDK